MSKLSRHDIRPVTISQRRDEDRAPLIDVSKTKIDGTPPDDENQQASIWRELNASHLPLDMTIDALSEAKDIDAVGRVSLSKMRFRGNVIEELTPFHGGDIAHDLFAFVTPRLRHPDMLRAERYGVLLERLTLKLSAVPAELIAREGLLVLQQGLQWLTLLRQNRNSLIEA
ncbi:hypothetical protein RX327_31230 [Bradyrhizobium sp. BEA-2-5]|uniref:hypothetical protein n=1 Tax=Bradyrhizobium sp. BEA-2-5 TaxID=3080015 RepID=UPI00293E953F|nr:hypothetical protein [Bradyrhizobium sp. BEA-2-5]WOH80251.1 hypothetical protein RX327_31230 [Bradyrhizobium sp. BEA-2-5]